MSPDGGTGYVAIGNSVLTFNTISGVLGPTIAGDPSNTTGNAHWTVDQENGNLVAIGQSGQLAWLAPSTPGARWRDLASVPYGLPVVIGGTAYDVASVPVGSVSTTPPQTAPTCPIGNCASTPLEDVVIPISLATGTVGPAAVLGTAGHGTPPVILGVAQVQGSILIHTDPGDFLYQPGPHHVAQIAGTAAASSTTVGPNSVATSTGAEGWIAVGSNLVQPVIPDYLTYGTPASTNFPVDGVAVTRSGTRVLLFGSSKTVAVLSAGTGTVSTHFTMPALDYVSAAFLTNP